MDDLICDPVLIDTRPSALVELGMERVRASANRVFVRTGYGAEKTEFCSAGEAAHGLLAEIGAAADVYKGCGAVGASIRNECILCRDGEPWITKVVLNFKTRIMSDWRVVFWTLSKDERVVQTFACEIDAVIRPFLLERGVRLHVVDGDLQPK